ncbi:MAG: ATP-NAD kinase family protein [Pseudomonadota bacterium]|nr:ATP-NAD kinase family protein [Pseudomonadota bacterium]
MGKQVSEKKCVGLIVNPVAGMGGSVGLKGTDGGIHKRALALGARPVAPSRAKDFLSRVQQWHSIRLLVAPQRMGRAYLGEELDVEAIEIGEIGEETSGEDTKRLAGQMLARGAELIVFVGGDGTARDIYDAIDLKVPAVGVPSGVKVYSSVFGTSVRAAAALVDAFVVGAELSEGEVLDIDEGAFRRGVLDARLYGYLRVPRVRHYLQGGKETSGAGAATLEDQKEIAEYVAEGLEEDTLYLLGPGTTVKAVADVLQSEKTLLGVDAAFDRKIVGRDLNEREILRLFRQHSKRKIIVTPLGGNGFVFGRGNRQFTPEVIRQVGRDGLIIIATRDKLEKLKCLRVDTDDDDLNGQLAGYIDVIIGYKYSKLMPVEC